MFVQVLGLSSIEMDAIFRADGAPIQLMLYAVNSSDFTSYTALVRVDFFRRSPAPLPKDTKLEDPTVEATVRVCVRVMCVYVCARSEGDGEMRVVKQIIPVCFAVCTGGLRRRALFGIEKEAAMET